MRIGISVRRLGILLICSGLTWQLAWHPVRWWLPLIVVLTGLWFYRVGSNRQERYQAATQKRLTAACLYDVDSWCDDFRTTSWKITHDKLSTEVKPSTPPLTRLVVTRQSPRS